MSTRQLRQMPALFVGHGSPMNAIENNDFSRGWEEAAARIPRPRAILCVSAHWYTDRSLVNTSSFPETIHDFYGFPHELHQIKYPARGATDLAAEIRGLPGVRAVEVDERRGIDHGAWVVLRRMYPEADIPVAQLSLDYSLSNDAHYRLGAALRPLRNHGVLILGSGNIVHNLGLIDWAMPEAGFDWAEEFRAMVNELILAGDHRALIDHHDLGHAAARSVPTPDHYWPLLYVLGAASGSQGNDYGGTAAGRIEIFNDACVLGSVSMTAVMIGSDL